MNCETFHLQTTNFLASKPFIFACFLATASILLIFVLARFSLNVIWRMAESIGLPAICRARRFSFRWEIFQFLVEYLCYKNSVSIPMMQVRDQTYLGMLLPLFRHRCLCHFVNLRSNSVEQTGFALLNLLLSNSSGLLFRGFIPHSW